MFFQSLRRYILNPLTQYTYLLSSIDQSSSVHSTVPLFGAVKVRSPYKTHELNISYFKEEINAILRPIFE